MDGAIDPSTTLRQQDTPAVGRDCVGDGVWCELHFERREVLHHKCRKVSILAEGEQVLLVKGIDITFRVFFNDSVGDNERAALVGSTDAVHAEATRQASYRTEERFECLREMVRNVVLVNLGEVKAGQERNQAAKSGAHT